MRLVTGQWKLISRLESLFRDFGATIEKVANSYGCSVNRTYCGHGINSLFHPAPSIPHYAKNKAPHYCKPGMVSLSARRLVLPRTRLTVYARADLHHRTHVVPGRPAGSALAG